ncbi:MAG: hypothetical protein AAF597_20660 [Bacteroidota bacterium]
MRTAIILFALGLGGLFLTDYLTQLGPSYALQRQGEQYPGVKEFIAGLETAQDLRQDPVITKEIPGQYFFRVTVYPGFRIIHNPDLGRKMKVTAPEGAFPHLKYFGREGRFEPDFTRPVKINQHVIVELNIEAFGSKNMQIRLDEAFPGRTRFQPDFQTVGPLSFQYLKLMDIPDQPIEINGKDLVVFTNDDATNLTGKVEHLEFIYSNNDSIPPVLEAPNLIHQKVFHHQYKDGKIIL